ncbi:MAG: nickel pincer cofactor biosynthesis protein LarB [Clostridiales Family XIII bacterium]|jgi:NCAIR mutase (PurE)-related protein|nr:nickel pincer cofactor biosynthesis protein LarB [Clostridiales Family XIII bacterium]
MKQQELKNLLVDVAEGKVLPEQAAQRLSAMPYDDIGIAKIDGHRELRTGRAEVIYGLGKTPGQVAKIMGRLSENSSPVIATKASAEAFDETGKLLGESWRHRAVSYGETEEYLSAVGDALAARAKELFYFRDAGLLVAVGGGIPANGGAETGGSRDKAAAPYAGIDGFEGEAATLCTETKGSRGEVAILCAGTADIPIAEEAALTAGLYGCRVQRQYDVGVAGIHRLFSKVEDIKSADAVIVAAGMEGALPSVVGGLVSVPVIAVPTSVGYGVSMGGLTALFAMLSGCALGVSVVNIDNGFGAGYIASMIASQNTCHDR